MSLTTAGGASILTPEQVDQLVVRPFSQESVTMRVGTVVPRNDGKPARDAARRFGQRL